MIIAIFGSSGSGKTSLAGALSSALSLPVRSCGDAVRDLAKFHGCSLLELSEIQHSTVDQQTVAWAQSERCGILEGRFLDRIVHSLTVSYVLVELYAPRQTRRSRILATGKNFDEVRNIDLADDAFRERMYTANSSRRSAICLNTSELSVEECVAAVTSLVQIRSRKSS